MSAAVPLLPKSFSDAATAQRRIAESVNNILIFQHDDSRIQTTAETLLGITPVNPAWPPCCPMRYGAKGDGIANDWAAVQVAFNVAGQASVGLSGGTVIFPPGYTFLCNADIVVPVPAATGQPVPCAQGPGWSNVAVIFGVGSNHGFVILGTGATTGGTTSTAYNDAGTFRDMLIELTNTGGNGNGFYCNSVNQPRIESCWIRGSGTNGCGAFFLNCLVPVFENCLVTGCGSSTQYSVEFDTCTSVNWRGSRISGGVTTKGGLAIDRCTVVLVDGCSSESCGIPIVIAGKAESSLACTDIAMRGLELENPGNGNAYIDIGAGLSGSALVLDVLIDGFYGSPSGTTSIPYAVRAQNFVGLHVRGAHFTFGTSATSCFELVGTNLAGVTVAPHRNLSSLGIPWVRYNGTQDASASALYEWTLGVVQNGTPVAQSKGLENSVGATISGTTPTVSLGAMGGYNASMTVSNPSATTMTLAGGAPEMRVTLYFANGNTTLSVGTGAGQFNLRSGQANPPVAATALQFWNDGQSGAGGSRWTQL